MSKHQQNESVVIGMSGGVDSSVSAALLVERGYDVTGLFMKNWEEDDLDGECSAEEDLADTQTVCEILGIPLETVNFSYEYWEKVFTGFLAELKYGRTPNPDIVCNVEIKFREFPHWALRNGTDYVATGHYARIAKENGDIRLLRGIDPDKDQTYFLYALDGSALQRALFPIGDITKVEVRERAKKLGLPNHDKKGSTGICFIGRRNFRSFVTNYLESMPGTIETPDGVAVGEHEGAILYTIGQRTGLGIGGAGESWYVAQKDIDRNVLIAVQGHDHPLLFSKSASASQLNWIGGEVEEPIEVKAKVRYRGEDESCRIIPTTESTVAVEFERPLRAVTPGQSIVFYDDEVCLGGAVIDSVEA